MSEELLDEALRGIRLRQNRQDRTRLRREPAEVDRFAVEDVETAEPNELLTHRLAEGARDVGRAILGTEGENLRCGRALLGEERIEQPAHAQRIVADEVMGDERPLLLAPFDQPLDDQDIRRPAHGDAADARARHSVVSDGRLCPAGDRRDPGCRS